MNNKIQLYYNIHHS